RVDAPGDSQRRAAGAPRAHHLPRTRSRRLASEADPRARHRAGAAEPQPVPGDDRARERRDRRLHASRQGPDRAPARRDRGARPPGDRRPLPRHAPDTLTCAQAAATTGLVRTPIPSTSTSTTSPFFIETFGSRAQPTPGGVPVRIRSPGSSVKTFDTYATR